MVIGIDEVGRGCVAGPVCVAAVSLSRRIVGLGDSKTIPAAKRIVLSQKIKLRAEYVRIGWASAAEVDEYNIVGALRLAAERALSGLTGEHEILLDGKHNYLKRADVRTIVGGDAIVPCISAASIVAKVARDAYMHAQHQQYESYGFLSHVGYATKQHRDAIAEFGPSVIHRMSFAPLKGGVYAFDN